MDRIENLRFIVRSLLDERHEAAGAPLPDSLPQLQVLMRSLLNVRPPAPISDALLTAQDAELQCQLGDKGAVGLQDIAANTKHGRIRLWQGDITRLRVDAIVNAANSALLGCFVPMHRCIDNAIHSAAGVQLRLECERIMKEQGGAEPTGRAKMTGGYNLPARHVIHTVGPIVRGVKASHSQEKELEDCYRSCLRIADEYGLRSIALCCISTGEFGFPPHRAAEIAVSTVTEYLVKEAETHIECVIFNVFKDSDYDIYRELLQ